MRYILYGADDFSSHEALKEIKKGLGDPDTLASNTTQLEGAKLTPADLRAAAEAFPFFGEKRLVIVSGLLGRFEASRKTSNTRSAKAARESKKEDPLPFASLIKSLPPSTLLVLLDGEIGKANPLLQEISSVAEVREFAPLKKVPLESWVQKRVGLLGGSISSEALELLVKLVGSDLWVMAGEVDKLVLYAQGRGIEAADVDKVVGYSREANIFNLVDGLVDGRLNLAQQSLEELLQAGIAAGHILSMLSRQLRLMVLIKEFIKQGKSEPAIQTRLGLKDYSFRKTLEQMGRYSMPRLKEFYHRLLETDLVIKTGRYDDELALSILVSDICSQPKTLA